MAERGLARTSGQLVAGEGVPVDSEFGEGAIGGDLIHESSPLESPMVTGIERVLMRILLGSHILWLALRCYGNPAKAISAMRKLIKCGRLINGDHKQLRYARADGRYFWSLNDPGWPSMAFNLFIENELNRLHPFRPDTGRFQTMFFAITKNCPLRCEHCFEWDALNGLEVLSRNDLNVITRRFQDRGVAQIYLSGGEPIRRIYDILGGQVRTLVQGMEEPGYKSTTWDGTNDLGQQLSPEVCLYCIQAGDCFQTRKIILLR